MHRLGLFPVYDHLQTRHFTPSFCLIVFLHSVDSLRTDDTPKKHSSRTAWILRFVLRGILLLLAIETLWSDSRWFLSNVEYQGSWNLECYPANRKTNLSPLIESRLFDVTFRRKLYVFGLTVLSLRVSDDADLLEVGEWTVGRRTLVGVHLKWILGKLKAGEE